MGTTEIASSGASDDVQLVTAVSHHHDPLRPLRAVGPRTIVSVAMIVVVLAFGFFAAHSASWTDVELPVDQWFAAHRTAVLTAVATGIAWLFSPLIASALTAVIAVVVGVVTRSLLRAVTFALVVGVNSALAELTKSIVRRPRPVVLTEAHPFASPMSFSYPSGHTCFAAAIGIAVIFVARDVRSRWAVVAAATVVTFATALSRIYLGVHYPSDVVASMVFTPAVITLVLALWLNVVLPRRVLRDENRRHAGA